MEESEIDNDQKIEFLSDLLAKNFLDTVKILAALTATNEKFYEGSHSRFVSDKSVEVAQELELSDEQIFEIKIAGLLHDIGKIGFPDSIMSKHQSEMSESEHTQYLLHPEIAWKLLSTHSGFEIISKIIFQHHERLDGSGFPLHLQGKEIHPGAAIIAVVDTYHNIFYKKLKGRIQNFTNGIPYTNTPDYLQATQKSFVNAMNFLYKKRGQLFDSKVVEIFTDIIELERRNMGKSTVMRMPIGKIEAGMLFAEDYHSSVGMLLASRGERISDDTIKSLKKYAELGEIPMKILVMRI